MRSLMVFVVMFAVATMVGCGGPATEKANDDQKQKSDVFGEDFEDSEAGEWVAENEGNEIKTNDFEDGKDPEPVVDEEDTDLR